MYYRWLTQTLSAELAAFRPMFAGLRIRGATLQEKQALARLRADIIRDMDAAAAAVEATLLQYGQAFASLTDGQPAAFRTFLLSAPSLFMPMGEAIGVLQHIQSFWRFRFPPGSHQMMTLEEAQEVLHEFASTLSGLAGVQCVDGSLVI